MHVVFEVFVAKFIIQFTLLLCLSFYFVELYANEAPKKINCATSKFSPYAFGEGKQLKGIEIDIFSELENRTGINIDINIMPFKRMLANSRLGEVDCVFSIFKTEERMKYLHFTSVPIHTSTLTIYAHRDNDFESILDLQGKNFGTVRGFVTPPEFKQAADLQLLKKSEVTHIQQVFRMLSKQMFDATIVDKNTGDYQLKKLNITNVISQELLMASTPAYIAFAKSKNTQSLVSIFNEALAGMIADGTYEQIFNKHAYIQPNNY